jgi:hypothetical protein
MRATMRLLDAVGAPEGTTLAHLMGSWWDAEGASRSSNSPVARAVNTSRDGVTTAEFKRTLAVAARTAPQELDAKTRQELTEYLRRAFAHVHRFHPLTSPALGKGDSSAGALVDAVDTGVRNELASKVSRFFDAFSPKDARAEKMPRWCGDPSDSALQDMWGAGRDLVWLVALVAWLQERDVKAEAGLTFHRRVSRRYGAASGRTLPVTPGDSVESVFDDIATLLHALLEMEEDGISPSAGLTVGDLLLDDAEKDPTQILVEKGIRELLRAALARSGSENLNTNPGVDTLRALSSCSARTLLAAFNDWRHTLGGSVTAPNFMNVCVAPRRGGGGGGGSGGGGGGGSPRGGFTSNRDRSTSNPRTGSGGTGGGGGGRTPVERGSPVARTEAGTDRGSPRPSGSRSPGVQRCYKCQGEGHMASECTNPQICGNCYRKGHDRSECSNAAVCSVCRKEGHLRSACTMARSPTPGAAVRFGGDRSSSAGSERSAGGASAGSQYSANGSRYPRSGTQFPRRSVRLAKP